MALILNIETATPVLSVALGESGKVLDIKELNTQNRHSEQITLFIEALLQQNNKTFDELDAVAVSEGPGSYTGLRIGVSTAKGICYAGDLPLIAVSTLKAMARMMQDRWQTTGKSSEVIYCPMIDARRMEVYAAFFDSTGNQIRQVQADIIDDKSYSEYLNENTVIFGGNGASKCKEVLTSPNAVFLEQIYPSAGAMAPLAEASFQQKDFVDVAYFEPFYLKAFKAGKPKVKGLYD